MATLILEMLCPGEMYGLEMVKASEGRLKRGTVYVTLARMEEKGYIESREVEEDSGPSKRTYRVTGHGFRVLAAWQLTGAAFVLVEPARRDVEAERAEPVHGG